MRQEVVNQSHLANGPCPEFDRYFSSMNEGSTDVHQSEVQSFDEPVTGVVISYRNTMFFLSDFRYDMTTPVTYVYSEIASFA